MTNRSSNTELPLCRLDISDTKKGVPLFERVWKWSGVANSFAICSLVRVFYQVSRSVGNDGVVTQVLFDPLPSTTSDKDRPQLTSKYITVSRKNKHEAMQSIQLTCDRNDGFIVAVFHDIVHDGESVKLFVRDLVKNFQEKFGEELAACRETIDKLDPEKDTAGLAGLMDKFKGFDEYVVKTSNELIVKIRATEPRTPRFEDKEERSP